MIMQDSNCQWCGTDILVNVKEWNTTSAHTCILCTAPSNLDPDDAEFDEEWELFTDLSDYDDEGLFYEDMPALTKPRCECGAQKIGSPWHSGWCPLSPDNQHG